MEKGHPILYGILGLVTYPIGGVVAGVLYANKAREANALRGINDTSLWHNPVVAGAIGLIFPGIGGLCYGYAYGKKETEVGQLKAAQGEQLMRMHANVYSNGGMGREVSANWRDRVMAEQQGQSLSR